MGFEYRELKEMVGVTMVEIKGSVHEETLTFIGDNGKKYIFHYEQDCCASCDIEDIVGDLQDLIGSPITLAEEDTNVPDSPPKGDDENYYDPESFTWTFYNFGTAKGRVTVRWYGSSNGYYSESPSFSIED